MKAGPRRLGWVLLLAPLAIGVAGDSGRADVLVLATEPDELGCWLQVETQDEAAERFALLAGPQLCDPERRGGPLTGRKLAVRWREVEWPRCLECDDQMWVRQLTDAAPAARPGAGLGCGAG